MTTISASAQVLRESHIPSLFRITLSNQVFSRQCSSMCYIQCDGLLLPLAAYLLCLLEHMSRPQVSLLSAVQGGLSWVLLLLQPGAWHCLVWQQNDFFLMSFLVHSRQCQQRWLTVTWPVWIFFPICCDFNNKSNKKYFLASRWSKKKNT